MLKFYYVYQFNLTKKLLDPTCKPYNEIFVMLDSVLTNAN